MVHNLEITILSEYIIFHYVASVIDTTQVHIHKTFPERSNKVLFVKTNLTKKNTLVYEKRNEKLAKMDLQ